MVNFVNKYLHKIGLHYNRPTREEIIGTGLFSLTLVWLMYHFGILH